MKDSFKRIYELPDSKLVIVEDMFSMRWGVNGEAWKCRRRLFAWEEELVWECVGRPTSVCWNKMCLTMNLKGF
jgi:hypothetical protein